MASALIACDGTEASTHDEVDAGEAELIGRARARDPLALKTIYERDSRAIFRFLRDLLGDAVEASDGMQETFRRAFQNVESLEDAQRLRPWLFGIARHVSLEHRKGRRREPAPDEREERRAQQEPDEVTPELLFLRHEAAAVMRRTLSRLSEDRRTILLLIDHGLSYLQIADLMNWSLAKVKVELHRAREQLRAEMASQGGER